jgi:hypothetical protein
VELKCIITVDAFRGIAVLQTALPEQDRGKEKTDLGIALLD